MLKQIINGWSWIMPVLVSVLASVFAGDASKKSFWSWRRWWKQRSFLHAQKSREDIFRNLEYNFSEWASNLDKTHKMLDIGTSQTVFGGYLAEKSGCSLFAMDYDALCEEFQESLYRKLGLKNAKFIVGDATHMDFPSNSFDRILAVSAIEHFEGNGDALFMSEAYRVLKAKGLLIVTVPYSHEYRENHEVTHYHGFERRYNLAALKKRLLRQTGMKLKHLFFINQRINNCAGRRVAKKYESLDCFFGEWYEKDYYLSFDKFAILLTKALLYAADKPDDTTCGAMFALEKE